MPKRKREDEIDGRISRIEDQAVRIKASRLTAKLEQSNKTLKDAIQLARGFERQKLSRRQKQAERQPHTLLRLREEVIVVKELDASKVAKNYLFKQLVKTKKIKESPAFEALFGQNPKFESSQSTAEGNVLGRLFKSSPVKEVLPAILQSIRDILAVDGGQPDGDVLNSQPANEVEFVGFSDPEESETKKSRDTLLDGISLDYVSGEEWEQHDSDQDLAKYHDRVVASSEESGSDSGTAEDAVAIERTSSSGSEDIAMHEKNATQKKNGSVTKVLADTSFLPSLSMGGYYSGSESDAEDGYDPDNASMMVQQRKNRRGQRARRELAAKKYGQNAKHLVKEREGHAEAFRGHDAGWDPKRGAVGGVTRDFTRGPKGRGERGITGGNRDAVNPEKSRARQVALQSNKQANGPLHPSWEAARNRKIESKNAAFSGKKITFE